MKRIIFFLLLIAFIPTLTLADEISEDFFSDETLEGHLEYNEVQENIDDDANAIYLDLENKKRINFTTPKTFTFESSKFNKIDNFELFNSKLESASKFSTQEYMISPTASSLYRKNGKFSFGTTYNSYLDSADMNQQTAIFTRYDTKKFAFTTAFAKNTGNMSSYYKDKIYIVPELKLTKRLSIVDVLQSDTDMVRKKNEIVLRYTPKLKNNYNDLQLELGAGQSFYNNELSKSSIKFSTKFKL